ncbi:M16 family metallopeptidase [Sphaerisporangium aureirubrum]|uniref:M16 family metallopeptidase n=1 Tax=Sphaerisporangium aureirubrum TaxID=1544736 RepID=UPI00362ADD63
MIASESVRVPGSGQRVERFVLANGLRVVLNPDRCAPVAGVAVVYDVGMRSEPEGRTGFAHLFEHMMFQGSANLDRAAHSRLVQGAGGTFNGSTHLDYTEYNDLVPSGALERVLYLEADRMRGPLLTEESLRNQIAVVKEEIRVNVLGKPYGGFPWLKLPPVMFGTFANAHDGYGSFADLEAAALPEATAFFGKYYAAGNAALSLSGDFDPDHAARLVERYFGDVPARPAPERPCFAEPPLTRERRAAYTDELAPLPAVAAAWRVPDPIADMPGYLPYIALATALTDGESSRLADRLALRERMVTNVGGYVGFMREPFETRDPTALVLQAHLPGGGDPDKVLAVVDEELDRLATDGLVPGELARVRARMVTRVLRECDPVVGRAVRLGVWELQRGHPGLLRELPGLLAEVTADGVRAAAAALRPHGRARIDVLPGGGGR